MKNYQIWWNYAVEVINGGQAMNQGILLPESTVQFVTKQEFESFKQREFTKLQQDVTELQRDVHDVQKDLHDVKDDVAAIQTKMNGFGEDMAVLRSDNRAIKRLLGLGVVLPGLTFTVRQLVEMVTY